jgi:hypothetical protein
MALYRRDGSATSIEPPLPQVGGYVVVVVVGLVFAFGELAKQFFRNIIDIS